MVGPAAKKAKLDSTKAAVAAKAAATAAALAEPVSNVIIQFQSSNGDDTGENAQGQWEAPRRDLE